MGWVYRIFHVQKYTRKGHSKNLGDSLSLNCETCIFSLFNKTQHVGHMTKINRSFFAT
jgi:hypothetical protein